MNRKAVSRHLGKQQGFTLMEILIVITLIGVVLTMTVTNIMGKFDEGKQKITFSVMKQMQTALDDYYRNCNHYPSTSQGGLEALVAKPTVAPECRNYDPNGYLKDRKIPRDGWDHDFIYINEDNSNKYTLKSLGRDGKEGGEGFDRDIDINDPTPH